MAALALVGAVMTGCSSDDGDQQPENKSKVETLTTTVGFSADTRALTEGGVKTFAADETMAIVYTNNSGNTVKAVSDPLTADDISDGGKSADFTFTLEDADKTKQVQYIYPAAMANSDGSINYDALDLQDGSLETISSTLDLATYSGDWDGASLPSATLTNQLAILALTLKTESGIGSDWDDYTTYFIQVTVSDGTNTYTLDATETAEGTFYTWPIYVAMKPVTTETALSISADNWGDDGYVKTAKTMTARTYPAGSFSKLTLRMYKSDEEPDETWNFSKLSGEHELVKGYSPYGDVTLAGEGSLSIGNDYGYIYEYIGPVMHGFTFTAPSGKEFTRIVIYAGGLVEFRGNGWNVGGSKATWSGSETWSGSAPSVNFHGNVSEISSIVFTFKDE